MQRVRRRFWRAFLVYPPSPPEGLDRRGVRDWARRYWAYPTFFLGLAALVRASGWMIRDEGAGPWALTVAIVVPAGCLLSYWHFRRTGDLPGEPWARRLEEDERGREIAHASATYQEREARAHLVMRGTFRWSSRSEESRSLGLGSSPRLFATARAETGEPSKGTRVVVDRIVPGQLESEVEARWLLPEFVGFEVEPGTELTLRDGRRVIAQLRVREVVAAST